MAVGAIVGVGIGVAVGLGVAVGAGVGVGVSVGFGVGFAAKLNEAIEIIAITQSNRASKRAFMRWEIGKF